MKKRKHEKGRGEEMKAEEMKGRGKESQEVMTKIKQTAQFREGSPKPLDAYSFLYLQMVSVSVI